jgi:hypothetical protein
VGVAGRFEGPTDCGCAGSEDGDSFCAVVIDTGDDRGQTDCGGAHFNSTPCCELCGAGVQDEAFVVGAGVVVEVGAGQGSDRDVAEFCEASLLELLGEAGVSAAWWAVWGRERF